MEEVKAGSMWIHKASITLYKVMEIANAEKMDDGEWDTTLRVVYKSMLTGQVFVRKIASFNRSFQPAGDPG
jgi:hypothetical protein